MLYAGDEDFGDEITSGLDRDDKDEPREVPEPDWDDIRESREETRRERDREDAEQYLRDAAAADTHSSDRDPGAVDPWEDK